MKQYEKYDVWLIYTKDEDFVIYEDERDARMAGKYEGVEPLRVDFFPTQPRPKTED